MAGAGAMVVAVECVEATVCEWFNLRLESRVLVLYLLVQLPGTPALE